MKINWSGTISTLRDNFKIERNRGHFYFEIIGTIKIEKKLFQIKNIQIYFKIYYFKITTPLYYPTDVSDRETTQHFNFSIESR